MVNTEHQQLDLFGLPIAEKSAPKKKLTPTYPKPPKMEQPAEIVYASEQIVVKVKKEEGKRGESLPLPPPPRKINCKNPKTENGDRSQEKRSKLNRNWQSQST